MVYADSDAAFHSVRFKSSPRRSIQGRYLDVDALSVDISLFVSRVELSSHRGVHNPLRKLTFLRYESASAFKSIIRVVNLIVGSFNSAPRRAVANYDPCVDRV